MKIALIGYGKMGQLVEEVALTKGHTIVAIIDHHREQKHLTAEALKDADVCIDFTEPATVMNNIRQVAYAGKNLVVGTTGWLEQLSTVEELVDEYGIGLFYSPNFSIGVNLFLRIVEEAAKLISPYDEYDVGALELHHSRKVDSPSGTAKAIAETLIKNLKRKKTASYDRPQGVLEKDELHFASLRLGHIPGTHSVIFDSESDSITLTHAARGRMGFAIGAIAAAEWIHDKKGIYTMEDLFK